MDLNILKEVLFGKGLTPSQFLPTVDSIQIKQTYRPEGFKFATYSFNTETVIEGESIIGCGEDRVSREIAYEKAVSEIIERIAYKVLSRNGVVLSTSSNGWAAHKSLELAAQSAVYELIERDSAVRHWLTYTPMNIIDSNEVLPSNFINELKLTEFPVPIVLISFHFSGPLATVLLADDKGFAVSGHSSGPCLGDAVKSATIEACRAAHHYQRFSFYSDTQLMHNNINILKVDPGIHSLMYAYHKPIPNWLFGKTISFISAKAQWTESAALTMEVARSSIFDAFYFQNRIIVRAENPILLPMFWGSTSKKIIDEFRLSNSVQLNLDKINTQPHMVG